MHYRVISFFIVSVTMLFGSSVFAADPLKIGALFAVTGPAAFLGEPERNTAKMVVDEINKDFAVVQAQVWARHILVADETAAQVVAERLNKGEDFATLANELSTDTSNNFKGGDLGYFPRGIMALEFEDTAFSLAIGEISQPVKTQFGYHIIQVLGRETRALDQNTFESARQGTFQRWFDEIKANSAIERFDRYFDFIPTEPNIPLDKQLF